ncbi:hypothetical protein E2542_SST18209 [Spatholobus suberectus]|nr:hypothetical protein E2542_SST18209 [Spatholobus suberectus]
MEGRGSIRKAVVINNAVRGPCSCLQIMGRSRLLVLSVSRELMMQWSICKGAVNAASCRDARAPILAELILKSGIRPWGLYFLYSVQVAQDTEE